MACRLGLIASRVAARPSLVRCALAPSLRAPVLASPLRATTISGLRFGSGRAEEPPKEEPAAATASTEPVHVYEGAKNKIVSTLKKLSVANLGFALAAAPLLQYITAATGNSGKGVAMSALVRSAGENRGEDATPRLRAR